MSARRNVELKLQECETTESLGKIKLKATDIGNSALLTKL